MKYFYLLLLSFCGHGQQLHHQMIAAQGGSNLFHKGVIIHQSIGQQSVSGNYSTPKAFLGQGFIQSLVLNSKKSFETNNVLTKVYPNPFVDQIQFEFSQPVSGFISVSIFDMLGRLVYSVKKESINNQLLLENLGFAQNQYIITLVSQNYKYSTQLIKTK